MKELSKKEQKRRAKKLTKLGDARMPRVGESAVLTRRYSDPESTLGRRVTIQRVTDDDWYTETFGDVRYWITDYSYLLAEDFAEHYEVAPEPV